MGLIVVIPTYNEADNLEPLTGELISLPIPDLRIIIIDDNSPDGTGGIADRLVRQHPGKLEVNHRATKLGLGSAYKTGFQRALDSGAEIIVQMDADFSHSPQVLPEMVRTLESCDLVIGSRYVPGGSVDRRWPAWRKGLSAFGNFYARSILKVPIRDMTGGYRVWRRKALQAVPLSRIRSNGYAFAIETAYLAHRLGFKILEIPIYFSDRSQGRSKMSLKIQLEAAYRVFLMRNEVR